MYKCLLSYWIFKTKSICLTYTFMDIIEYLRIYCEMIKFSWNRKKTTWFWFIMTPIKIASYQFYMVSHFWSCGLLVLYIRLNVKLTTPWLICVFLYCSPTSHASCIIYRMQVCCNTNICTLEKRTKDRTTF